MLHATPAAQPFRDTAERAMSTSLAVTTSNALWRAAVSSAPRLGVLFCSTTARADVRVLVTSSADGYGLDLLGPQGDGTGTDPAHEDWLIDPFRPT